jgi:ElaB/YqjD/DUF883 family membrane-anchored ribosome-binding protein
MPTSQATPVDVEDEVDTSADESEPLVERLENLGQQVGTFVRERPIASVGIALAAGFLIGRFLR